MSDEDTTKPKIIIDEGWKSQAQAEKEALAKEAQAKRQQSAKTSPAEAPPEKEKPDTTTEPGEYPLPPASFVTLCSTLATQAMIALGQIPHPLGDKAQLDLPQAKHFIDTLQVLDQKTQGNLTPQESTLLENVLHELRMAYVALSSSPSTRDADVSQDD